MAENDESNMIGYDPLAWLHEDTKSASVTEKDSLEIEIARIDENSLKSMAASSLEQFSVTDYKSATTDENDFSIESSVNCAVDSDIGLQISAEDLAGDSTSIGLDNTAHLASVDDSLDNTDNSIVLETIQSIQNVGLLHQRLQRVLDAQEKLEIDASAVTQIDTATLQMLLVLKLTAVKLQKEVNIDFPSQKFIDAAYLLGLAEMLSVDQAASGLF